MRIFREYPGFSSNFRGFPEWVFPIRATLKCNNMTPKALKLHLQSIKLQKSFYSLQSIKLQKSFYSSNFCYFTCAMMSRFAKFQGFFSSTILIPEVNSSAYCGVMAESHFPRLDIGWHPFLGKILFLFAHCLNK
jgi:hypothetical protein